MTNFNNLNKRLDRLEQRAKSKIMVSDASIKTVTIEVKVMKIGNRQVTLAVFRQLPVEPVINLLTWELRGIPWGRVNYHVGCEWLERPNNPMYEVPHVHVVWQKDNELRHAIHLWRDYCVHDEIDDLSTCKTALYRQLEQLDQLFIAV